MATTDPLGAADPAAHTAAVAPIVDRRVHQLDELPEPLSTAPTGSSRWRLSTGPAPAPQLPGLDASGQAVRDVHAHPGDPDPDRRHLYGDTVQAGDPGHVRADLAIMPEETVNRPGFPDPVPGQQPPPIRPSQGWTGADNTRGAVGHQAFTLRPFDKLVADHLGAFVEKAPTAPPRAAVPPMAAAVDQPLPSPGGSGPVGHMPGVGIAPNSFRLLPTPWDETLVTLPAAAIPARQAPAGRSWRLS